MKQKQKMIVKDCHNFAKLFKNVYIEVELKGRGWIKFTSLLD